MKHLFTITSNKSNKASEEVLKFQTNPPNIINKIKSNLEPIKLHVI